MSVTRHVKDLLEAEYLRECLKYCPGTGVVVWKKRPSEHFGEKRIWKMWNTSYSDKVAGGINERGYLVIRIDGVLFRLHRVIWAVFYGEDPGSLQVDHINHIKTDNRISNLRLVDNKVNHRNMPKQRNNTSGESGVYWHEQCSKWNARILDNGCFKSLGLYESFHEAVSVRRVALSKLGFHENHGRDYA